MFKILFNNIIVLVIFLILGITVSKVKADDCAILKEAIEIYNADLASDFKDGNCCKNTSGIEVICNGSYITGL